MVAFRVIDGSVRVFSNEDGHIDESFVYENESIYRRQKDGKYYIFCRIDGHLYYYQSRQITNLYPVYQGLIAKHDVTFLTPAVFYLSGGTINKQHARSILADSLTDNKVVPTIDINLMYQNGSLVNWNEFAPPIDEVGVDSTTYVRSGDDMVYWRNQKWVL